MLIWTCDMFNNVLFLILNEEQIKSLFKVFNSDLERALGFRSYLFKGTTSLPHLVFTINLNVILFTRLLRAWFVNKQHF